MRLAILVALIGTAWCLGQGPGGFQPASSNVMNAQYPRVDGSSRVEIRFKAPEIRAKFG